MPGDIRGTDMSRLFFPFHNVRLLHASCHRFIEERMFKFKHVTSIGPTGYTFDFLNPLLPVDPVVARFKRSSLHLFLAPKPQSLHPTLYASLRLLSAARRRLHRAARLDSRAGTTLLVDEKKRKGNGAVLTRQSLPS